MKRISTYLGLLLLASLITFDAEAQLSERINNPSSLRIGTRPVEGNFGFFIAVELDQFEDLFDEKTTVEEAIPLINVRYYMRDDLALRVGLSSWKKSRTLEGEIDNVTDPNDPNPGPQGVGDYTNIKEVDAYTLLHLGIEKHFKASNLLDGYIGLSLPLGYTRGSAFISQGVDGANPDYENIEVSRFSFVYGAELFVGTNAFIADLPLAVGVELGLKGLGIRGDKFKTEYEGRSGGVDYSGEYFTNNIDDFDDPFFQAEADRLEFSSLKARSFDTQALIRFSISYFFK
ncbi:MAG: hypothetical protein CMP59_07285 [Flavobacteriales bacterium]|nr:hypothetical protein [Flavobacteriales bacterium]|tara:strand:+ start:430 stop:1293 length:864 start_codon:yes stop_codon:yes gene_type:complete